MFWYIGVRIGQLKKRMQSDEREMMPGWLDRCVMFSQKIRKSLGNKLRKKLPLNEGMFTE